MFLCENLTTARRMLAYGWGFLNAAIGTVFVITMFYINNKLTRNGYSAQYSGQNSWNGGGQYQGQNDGYYGGNGGGQYQSGQNYGYYGGEAGGQYQGDPNDEEWSMINYEVSRSRMILRNVLVAVAVTACVLAFFGFAVLGFFTPFGYRHCSVGKADRCLKPWLAVFIGSIILFANVLLGSAIFFGIMEDNYSDNDSYYQYGDQDQSMTMFQMSGESSIRAVYSTLSAMCLCLAIAYLGYGIVSCMFQEVIVKEAKHAQKRENLDELNHRNYEEQLMYKCYQNDPIAMVDTGDFQPTRQRSSSSDRMDRQNSGMDLVGMQGSAGQMSGKSPSFDGKNRQCSSAHASDDEEMSQMSRQRSDVSTRIERMVLQTLGRKHRQGSGIGETGWTSGLKGRGDANRNPNNFQNIGGSASPKSYDRFRSGNGYRSPSRHAPIPFSVPSIYQRPAGHFYEAEDHEQSSHKESSKEPGRVQEPTDDQSHYHDADTRHTNTPIPLHITDHEQPDHLYPSIEAKSPSRPRGRSPTPRSRLHNDVRSR